MSGLKPASTRSPAAIWRPRAGHSATWSPHARTIGKPRPCCSGRKRRSGSARQSTLDQAESLLDADRCDDAATLLAEARGLDPTAASATDLARRIDRCRAKAARAAVVEKAPTVVTNTAPAASTLSEARRRELTDLYQRGVRALESGRSGEAVHYWEMVWSADPEFEGVQDRLLQGYLTLGMEEFANGQLRAAVDRWERAVRVAPDDPRARGYLERAHKQLQQMERISAGR